MTAIVIQGHIWKIILHKCKWTVKKTKTNLTHFKIGHYLYMLTETRNNKAKKNAFLKSLLFEMNNCNYLSLFIDIWFSYDHKS